MLTPFGCFKIGCPKTTNIRVQRRYCSKTTPPAQSGLKVGILGVPFEEGQSKIGVANGPHAIRNGGLFQQMKTIYGSLDIKDYGDIKYKVDPLISQVPNMKGYEHVASCNLEVSKRVHNIMKDGRICFTIGGDHSIGLGTIDGHIKAKGDKISVIWVDAHADMNTNQTSETGNIHGMPMALLVKEMSDYWPYLPGMDWQKPVMSIRNAVYIGLRSVDAYERLAIDQLDIAAYGMEDVEMYGIHTVVEMALQNIDPKGDRSIHISFDIDALDPLEAPSTGTAVRGGLTLREAIHIIETVYDTGRLHAMDLVEVNPTIGSMNDIKKTVDAAICLLLAACGHVRRGHSPHNATMPLPTFPASQPRLTTK